MVDTLLLDEMFDMTGLTQGDIIAAGIATINHILVDKGIATADDINDQFVKSLAERGIKLKPLQQDAE